MSRAAGPVRAPWFLALPLAALGGLALVGGMQPVGSWLLGLIGALLVLGAVWQQRAGLGLVAGLVAGSAFWLPQIAWLTLYLGPVPWLGLSAVMVVWFALWGGATGLVTRAIARLPMVRAARMLVQVLAAAGVWVLREQVQSFWPYGGFAWGRLVHTQAGGPLAEMVSWLGFTGSAGVLVVVCAVPVAVFGMERRWRPACAGLVAAVLGVAALAWLPAAELPQQGTLRVAAVQGNSKSGIFDDRENGDVFAAHVDATEALLDRLDSNGERVDVIVWPENSAEFGLPQLPYREAVLQRLAARAGAPIVVGAVLKDPDGSFTNSSLVYDGNGDTGLRYDKRRPVPFAEYMPDRAFFHALAPDLVDLVQLDYRFGARPAVLDIDGASGSFAAGIAICFDIAFDDHAEALMGRGPQGDGRAAQVIFAQTNNADFGRTSESAQQLAIARLRAIESGRALVNISTVGTSAIVLPDGTEADRLPTHTADAMVATVPLVNGETPALRFGAQIAAAWMAVGAGGLVIAVGEPTIRRLRGARAITPVAR